MKSLPIPLNDCVLVEINSSPYKVVAATESKYDTRTSGKIIAVDSTLARGNLLGKIGHWREYKDDCRIKVGEELYALVEYKDILGVTYAD